MQCVLDGPDFLWAAAPTFEADDRAEDIPRWAGLTLRDTPKERAADIAVMAFALLNVREWPLLHPWWSDRLESRTQIHYVLERITTKYRGQFKLAVIQTAERGLDEAVLKELEALGFKVVRFAPVNS